MNRTFKRASALLLAGTLALSMAPGIPVSAAAKKPKSIQVTGKKTLYLTGQSKRLNTKLKVQIKPKKALQKVSFSSSNKSVAKVTAKGVVKAVGEGKATITVKSKANKKVKKTIKITVKNGSDEDVTINLEGNGTVTHQIMVDPDPMAGGTVSYVSSNPDVATVNESGIVTANRLGQTVITAASSNNKVRECTVTVSKRNRDIHDPSVYRDPVSGKYYSFGSHLRAVYSSDLIGWSTAASTDSNYNSGNTLFTKNYKEEFEQAYAFTMPNGAKENAWAPDIIYNTSMKKYCMYMSIVDGKKKCCIAMASSDQPDGPYEYKGMLVCSGLAEKGNDIDKTNVAAALNLSDEEARQSKYANLGEASPDCIDPTVFYDHKGNLWMVYGSFTTSGGIRLLKLDPETGLRGTNYADSNDGGENGLSTDDPYYGKKIANSNGEGPYIQMVKSRHSSTGYYYYLWTSTGNLQYYGGYNMRLVRAENPEGPYYDTKGQDAARDLQKYALGLRVMDNYQFSFMDSANVSCGGNSATDDGNGKTFIQFHQRTSASDGYVFRTHQTFENEDGWLVTAPFEYNGETIKDSYSKQDVAGTYEFLYHRDYFAKTTIKNMDYIQSERLTLNEDGTVSGAYKGTWELNGHYFTIHINEQDYKGVVLEQYEQNASREKVMVFTAVGKDNRTVWGSKMHKTDAQAAKYDAEHLSIPETVTEDFELPQEGLFGSTITWESPTGAVSIENGKAVLSEVGQQSSLKAVVSCGSSTIEKKFTFMVDKMKEYQSVTNVTRPGAAEFFRYYEDYSKAVNDQEIAKVWTSRDQQQCLYVESDETHDSFIKFAAGNTSSSQGAQSNFGISKQAGDIYTVEFDVALEAGTNDVTEFAITGMDADFVDNEPNHGLESGYILKLSAEGDQDFTINDSMDSFELPVGWVHVTATADVGSKQVYVTIEDDKHIYYGGIVEINGKGELNGLYLHWAAKQSLISVDNVMVY